MNIFKQEIPLSCDSLIGLCDRYCQDFYLEMIRMSSLCLSEYIDNYISKLKKLTMKCDETDSIRACIGIIALHKFGYNDFDTLINIFDRIIPQKSEEIIHFTSYCAGILVHHPDTDQTHYVSHLFDRLVGWICGQGRRKRVLAATILLASLSEDAGSSIILFIEKIKTIIWHLISLPFPQLNVLETTAKAIKLTTRSIMRYGRSELVHYLSFCSKLCKRLLSYSNPIKNLTGLLIFCELIQSCPDFFIKDYLDISDLVKKSISDQSANYNIDNDNNDKSNNNLQNKNVIITSNKQKNNIPSYVLIAAFQVAVSLAAADPKQFTEIFSLSTFQNLKQIIFEYPISTVEGLNKLGKYVPNLIQKQISSIFDICQQLMGISCYDALFLLLEFYLPNYPNSVLFDFYQKSFLKLVTAPVTGNYRSFFVKISFCEQSKIFFVNKNKNLTSNAININFKSKFSEIILMKLKRYNGNIELEKDDSTIGYRINQNENHKTLKFLNNNSMTRTFSLNNSCNNLCMQKSSDSCEVLSNSCSCLVVLSDEIKFLLEMIAAINTEEVFINPEELFKQITKLTNSPSIETSSLAPGALFNLSKSIKRVKTLELVGKMLLKATMENRMPVRFAYLDIINKNCCKEFANNTFLNYYQILLNDDSYTVRRKILQILAKIVKFNPISISSITRIALKNSFNTLKNVPSMRQRARVAHLLPDLVSSSLNIVKTFSQNLIGILINVLSPEFSSYALNSPTNTTKSYTISILIDNDNDKNDYANSNDENNDDNNENVNENVNKNVNENENNIEKDNKNIKISSNDMKKTMLTNNFVEKNSVAEVQIGVIDSLKIVAPYDKEKISQYSDVIISLLCSHLNVNSNRLLILSILHCLQILMSPEAITIEIRAKSSEILAACSSFLSETQSRKARIAVLKVIGTIGVLDVHQEQQKKFSGSPKNIDDDLAKSFFNPNRDFDEEIDDTLLLKSAMMEQYYKSFVSKNLLEMLYDETQTDNYYTTISALVSVLSNPKMSSLSYFDSFVSRLLDVLASSKTISEKNDIIPLYTKLIRNSGVSILPFVSRSLDIIRDDFCDSLMIEYLDLILAFLEASMEGFMPYSSRTISLLVSCLDSMKTSNAEACKRVLKGFQILGQFATDFRYLIVPQICDAIVCQQTLSKIRIWSLDSLNILCQKTKNAMFNYYGLIIRALNFALEIKDEQTHLSSLRLILSLKQISDNLLFLLSDFCDVEIKRLLKDPSFLKYIDIDNQSSISSKEQSDKKGSSKSHKKKNSSKSSNDSYFAEESVIERAITPNLGLVKHLESWLNSLMLEVICCSPSPTIRACQKIANSSQKVAKSLFLPAFFSCWIHISPNGKKLIAKSFSELLLAEAPYDTVAKEILELCAFMDKLEKPIPIEAADLIKSCIRYGSNSFALYLLENKLSHCQSDDDVLKLIDIFLRVRRWPDAVSIWQKHFVFDENNKENNQKNINIPNQRNISPSKANDNLNNDNDNNKRQVFSFKGKNYNTKNKGVSISLESNVFAKLRMWDKAEEPYRKLYGHTRDPKSLVGLLDTLSKLNKWSSIIEYLPIFNKQKKKHQKQEISMYLAQAAIQLGNWEALDKVLIYTPINSIKCNMYNAMNCIHKHEWEKVDHYINHSFSILASRPITFWEEDQRIHKDLMVFAQQLIEIKEMKEWFICDPSKKKSIELVWDSRLKTMPKDFEQWLDILSNRIPITQIRNISLVHFFQLKSLTMQSKIHSNVFDTIYPDFQWDSKLTNDLDKLCFVVTKWCKGEKSFALEKIEELVKNINPELKLRANFYFACWLLEDSTEDTMNMLQKAYSILKETMKLVKNQCIVNQSISDSTANEIKSSYSSANMHLNLICTDSFYNNNNSNNNFYYNTNYKYNYTNFKYNNNRASSIDANGINMVSSNKGGLSCNNNHIMKYLVSNTVNLNILRKWASVNSALISLNFMNASKYINAGIRALNECTKLLPEFPDVVQLLNLFFENASIGSTFEKNHMFIKELPKNLLIQAFPQLLVQLSHRSPEVQGFVHDLIFEILVEHYHSIIFQIIVLEKSKNFQRAKNAHQILTEFKSFQPLIHKEVDLIRHVLLRTAVTYYEKAVFKLREASNELSDFMIILKEEQIRNSDLNDINNNSTICQSLEKISKFYSSLFKFALIEENQSDCVMLQQFLKEYKESIKQISILLKKFIEKPTNINSCNTLIEKTENVLNNICIQIQSLQQIQLSSISAELCSKNDFNLAVFGTYKPNKHHSNNISNNIPNGMNDKNNNNNSNNNKNNLNKNVSSNSNNSFSTKYNSNSNNDSSNNSNNDYIKIAYFVGQVGVFPSKQTPKNICIKGSDGSFYQYILKGNEDMRLDERIMQFFKLINSLIKKVTSGNTSAQLISTYSVIPLSFEHGLVQFVRGTDTFKAIVENYRSLHDRDVLIEYKLLDKYALPNFDNLPPIQKLMVNKKIFKEIPDSDISNFLWLKSGGKCAETWMKNVTTFSISNAVNSIVGYIIGVGDRHPSNLLLDRNSGKVVHIDFGDSFERAANRKILPEKVPFRLTRMMVKALGINGVDGTFRKSFIEMSQILRDNRRVLLMVLSIFVHEPLADPENLDSELEFNHSDSNNNNYSNYGNYNNSNKGSNGKNVVFNFNNNGESNLDLRRSNSDSLNKRKRRMRSSQLYRSPSTRITSIAARNDGSNLDLSYLLDSGIENESNEKIRDRVKKKLMGRDFDEWTQLSIEQHADLLIKEATSEYNMSRMYHGWFPYW